MGNLNRRSPAVVAGAVTLSGILVTLLLAWAAATAHRDNEDRLLNKRAEQGGAVLRAAIPGIEQVLVTTVAVAASGEAGEALLPETLGTQVGPERRFRSAAVWTQAAGPPSTVLGARPGLLDRGPDAVAAVLDRAQQADGMVVVDLVDADPASLGYAYERGGVVVYAEQPLAVDRTEVDQPDAAFDDVDYAIYLGDRPDPAVVLAASTPDLPLSDPVARTTVPFGDTTILLAMRPHGTLGGALLSRLPWLVLLLGAANTSGAAVVAFRLQRRRLQAESLAVENERLFTEQRDASQALQQSLLPGDLPAVPGVEIVARYRTGVEGTQVGGDWYDALQVDGRVVAVVGDVSGRGLAAVSTMASARHTTRAFASRGDEPGVVLDRVGAVERSAHAGQFATVACASFDPVSGELAVALAGHPAPIVVGAGRAELVPATPGPPVGLSTFGPYPTTRVVVPPGGTIYLFTDGLFERRGQTIDDGLDRLRRVLVDQQGDLATVVDAVLHELGLDGVADDTAVLAIRWAR
jgi:serine phosphatase RsbU (regulator of sigma subunit)